MITRGGSGLPSDRRDKLPILITGTRAPVALDIARRLAAAGHTVFAAESVDYHLCRVSRAIVRSYRVPKPNRDREGYLTAIRRIVQEQRIGMIVPTCEEVFHLAQGKAFIELGTGCKVLCESIDTLDRLHSKWKFMELLAGNGILTPYTERAESMEELEEKLRSGRFSSRVVLKPEYSRFSAKVRIIELDQPKLSERLALWRREGQAEEDINPSTPWVIQQYIEGMPLCTYTIAHEGEVTAHACYTPTFTAGLGAGIHMGAVQHEELWSWVKEFAARERFTGQFSFDFIVSAQDGRIYPIECNPRATSGVHLLPRLDEVFAEAIIGPTGPTRLMGSTGSIVPPSAPQLPLFPERGASCMLGAAMLLFGASQLRHPRRWRAWASAIRHSRDIIFRLDDPRPSLEQFRILLETVRIARAEKVSILEASTIDMEWNGQR
ncbi:ATP-grasp domain-containing protein [Paenibacillus chungangensis]|uniref:ATP-grasp domain-containing protein n=1 Tax=Paenibacillus chungangensis TaxID=696535 RepID=A0ABW3HW22_9BACL